MDFINRIEQKELNNACDALKILGKPKTDRLLLFDSVKKVDLFVNTQIKYIDTVNNLLKENKDSYREVLINAYALINGSNNMLIDNQLSLIRKRISESLNKVNKQEHIEDFSSHAQISAQTHNKIYGLLDRLENICNDQGAFMLKEEIEKKLLAVLNAQKERYTKANELANQILN